MKEYKYCDMCSKNEPGRMGEGYIVLSRSKGKENTKECPKCKGFGYLFIREYEVISETD
jgi:hypothetical protein